MEIFPQLKKLWASVKDDKYCEMKFIKIEWTTLPPITL